MIKRTIEISQEPAYLFIKHDQLQIRRNDHVVGSIPCEDIGVVLVDHPQASYSHTALTRLAESDAALIVCGRNHLPVAVLLPLAHHSEGVWRVRDQLAVSKPTRKRLWKQLVQAKLHASAKNLPPTLPARAKLIALAQQVRSGDPANIEARAARVYWSNWLPEEFVFHRDTDGDGINAFLNYGYAVLRAAIARALVAAGLLPAIGLKHSNRSNSFALADDLIEPLRSLVDHRVRELYCQGHVELQKESKAEILKLLADDVKMGAETGPLMVCIHRYVASLVKCYRSDIQRLLIPERLE